MQKARQQGFTLVELAIVLVIIGLIIGGVLVGAEMIRLAKIRAVVSQMQKYNTAVSAFRLKYDCLPGDCPNAVALGLGTSGGAGDNGDGNGMIHSYGFMFASQWANHQKENLNVWYHLSQAGMIEGG
jgi:prepilin-type N-terminal cleavage/methylation domain-containing protein